MDTHVPYIVSALQYTTVYWKFLTWFAEKVENHCSWKWQKPIIEQFFSNMVHSHIFDSGRGAARTVCTTWSTEESYWETVFCHLHTLPLCSRLRLPLAAGKSRDGKETPREMEDRMQLCSRSVGATRAWMAQYWKLQPLKKLFIFYRFSSEKYFCH